MPSTSLPRAALWRALLAAALLSTAATAALAQSGSEPLQAAQAQFQRAASGDSAAIDPAALAFARLHEAEPGNAVLLAYAGASTTLRATTTWLPWKKLTFAEDGLAQLDKALALAALPGTAPAHALEVKFVAANTFLGVPGFMNRAERGARLLQEIQASPAFAQSPLAFRGAVWLRAAQHANKAGNTQTARSLLEHLIAEQAPQAPQADALLRSLAS